MNKYVDSLFCKIFRTFLKWDKTGTQEHGLQNEKMIMFKALHLGDGIDWEYVKRNEDSVDETIHGQQEFTRKSKERVILKTKSCNKNVTRTNRKIRIVKSRNS